MSEVEFSTQERKQQNMLKFPIQISMKMMLYVEIVCVQEASIDALRICNPTFDGLALRYSNSCLVSMSCVPDWEHLVYHS